MGDRLCANSRPTLVLPAHRLSFSVTRGGKLDFGKYESTVRMGSCKLLIAGLLVMWTATLTPTPADG
jgi:hypothetical protein